MENKLTQSITVLATVLFLAACTGFENQSETADQRFLQSMEWNDSHSPNEINLSKDEYTILTMGDSHVGTTRNLVTFFNIAKSEEVAGVFMLGDLTGGKTNDYNTLQKVLPPKDSLLTFLMAGNHDLWNNCWNEFYSRFGSSTYYVTIRTPAAQDLFICLENSAGTLGKKQIEWLCNILSTKRPHYRHCLVLTHCNILRYRQSEVSNPPVEEIEFLLNLFSTNNVEMVVTAHDHRNNIQSLGNTSYVIIDALADGLSNAGYFNLKVNSTGLTYGFEYFQ